jgi:predicted membrane protein
MASGHRMKLTRWFLLGAIVSLLVAAFVGVIALLGFHGDIVAKSIVSTISISGYCILALACAAVLERRHRERGGYLAIGGFVVTAPSLLFALLLIWFGQWISRAVLDEEILFKTMMFGIIWPIYFAVVSLLYFPGKLHDWPRWCRQLAIIAATLLVAALSLFVVEILPENEIVGRMIGVLSIITGACSVVFPILLFIDKSKRVDTTSEFKVSMNVRCPRCGTGQLMEMGDRRCLSCGLKFHIEIDEPSCPSCGQGIHGYDGKDCPKCGRFIPPEDRWDVASSNVESVSSGESTEQVPSPPVQPQFNEVSPAPDPVPDRPPPPPPASPEKSE